MLSWCRTHTKISSTSVVMVTTGSQNITVWGPDGTPLGVLRDNTVDWFLPPSSRQTAWTTPKMEAEDSLKQWYLYNSQQAPCAMWQCCSITGAAAQRTHHKQSYQHVFSQPAFPLRYRGTNPQSKTFLSKQWIATVPTAIWNNFICIWPVIEKGRMFMSAVMVLCLNAAGT
jgi:hypothetical protein